MSAYTHDIGTLSRRNLLTGSAALLASGAMGGSLGAYAAVAPVGAEAPVAPPLPWKYVKLDPLEAGRRAYRNYFDKGGCGSATYLALVSMLREQVGYPWTTLPDMMMIHAASGYGGHGTLCGALGGTACVINLVAYSDEDDTYRKMIDQLFHWYSNQKFPTTKFDDISSIPNQVQVKAWSPLCHTSVSKWTLEAGEEVTSKAKKERCAKVSGEVVFVATRALNDYLDGNWEPTVSEPSDDIAHCIKCHGPSDVFHDKVGMNQQQGHMECFLCHDDHTVRGRR